MAHPVSVQVCTLNEEANIAACLAAIEVTGPSEIVVIDGGSTDRTVATARECGARVIDAGPVGLAAQRRAGFVTSECEYTAFVDADDRLAPDWLSTMVDESRHGGYAALQSLLRVPDDGTWWARGWDEYFRESIAPTADTIMVGRPALMRTEALLRLPEPTVAVVEDTEMSRQFQLMGLRQGIGTAVSFRLCPGTREENWRKWRGYGRGYRSFVEEHPDRRQAVMRHILFTVPVARSWRPVLRGRVTQPAFGAMMTGNIIAGWLGAGREPV